MAANEGVKDLLVLMINKSPSLSLATSHSTRNVGFNISSYVSVSMVTLQSCMHSAPLQKGEEIHKVHLDPVMARIFDGCCSLQEVLFHRCGAAGI